MSHHMIDVHDIRLAIVAKGVDLWTLEPKGNDDSRYPLVVNGVEMARFFFDKEGVFVVHYRSVNNGAIFVDGQVIHQLGFAQPVPSGSLVEIRNGAVYITTSGPLARFLCGNTNDVDDLFAVRDQDHNINNALAVWEDTAVSPDYLGTTGRAVYDRIVKVTGRRYQDRA